MVRRTIFLSVLSGWRGVDPDLLDLSEQIWVYTVLKFVEDIELQQNLT